MENQVPHRTALASPRATRTPEAPPSTRGPHERGESNASQLPPYTPGLAPVGGYDPRTEVALRKVLKLIVRGWSRRNLRVCWRTEAVPRYSVLGAIQRVMEIYENYPLVIRDQIIRLIHQAIVKKYPEFNAARLHSTGIGIQHWNQRYETTNESARQLVLTAIMLYEEASQ